VGREWSILVVDFWFSLLLAKVMTKLSNLIEFEGGHWEGGGDREGSGALIGRDGTLKTSLMATLPSWQHYSI